KHWRWLETNDKHFEHMTPIQGEWTISGIGLQPAALRKIYFDNAMKLLARSIPARMEALRTSDMEVKGALGEGPWEKSPVSRIEYASNDVTPKIDSSTKVRVLYSDKFLYVRYDAPYTELTTFEPARMDRERIGLWDRDVVELFIGSDFEKITDYYEFQTAPTGEQLDLLISKEVPNVNERIAWNSGFDSAVKTERSIWTTVMKIPLAALKIQNIEPGMKARLNFYRIDKAANAYIAWSPTLAGSYHKPERFGTLWFK
ncbi:MAG: carbohydrate-binding family 9-like protein, partial [Verrucomicrobiales bacterium]